MKGLSDNKIYFIGTTVKGAGAPLLISTTITSTKRSLEIPPTVLKVVGEML